ncbi:hypothetical protein Ga0080559_TMP4201 [Salipiger profundus]|uniref:Uncharacterized protein n=1 Tax=Salipiger profundus TaxID=1229727 RepID=A0A1U7D9Z3_9RHOB|nr:hypothetical protein Ga0080559_TMP4201 [Salipiger profundus]
MPAFGKDCTPVATGGRIVEYARACWQGARAQEPGRIGNGRRDAYRNAYP